MAILTGQKVVWGVPDQVQPIEGLPEGARVRYRFRKCEFGAVLVKTDSEIGWHTIKIHNGQWFLGRVISRNVRQVTTRHWVQL